MVSLVVASLVSLGPVASDFFFFLFHIFKEGGHGFALMKVMLDVTR